MWQYSPRRRWIAQLAMWVILAISLVVAAVVSAHRRAGLTLKLDRPQVVSGMTVSTPVGWQGKPARKQAWGRVMMAAEDADDSSPIPRTLEVMREPLPTYESPAEYLQRRFGLAQRKRVAQESLRIAGAPGVIVSCITRGAVGAMENELIDQMLPPTSDVIACATPPSGRPVAVHLRGLAMPGTEGYDLDLVRRVAASIVLNDEPALQRDAREQTVGGIRVTLPDGFAAVDAHDPQHTSVQLISSNDTDGANWRGIRLIPAVLAPGEQKPAAIATLLSLQDASWSDASVRDDGQSPRRWRVDDSDRNSVGAPRRAYVVADEQGRALIATFSGGGEDDAWVEPAWTAIVQKLDLSVAPDPVPMFDAGTALARSLRGEGDGGASQSVGRLYAEHTPPEQWLLQYAGSTDRAMGWSHVTPGSGGVKLDARRRFPGPDVHRVTCEWQWPADLKSYRGTLTHASAEQTDDRQTPMSPLPLALMRQQLPKDVADEMSAAFETVVTVASRVRDNRLELSTKPTSGGGTSVQIAPPVNFVPAGWLWPMLGQLPIGERGAIVRTDAAPDYVQARPTMPLTVILRPEAGDARSDGDTEKSRGLRCIAVEVVGSGEVLRYYFRPDGSLDRIEQPDGITAVPREAADIALDFARMPAMKP